MIFKAVFRRARERERERQRERQGGKRERGEERERGKEREKDIFMVSLSHEISQIRIPLLLFSHKLQGPDFFPLSCGSSCVFLSTVKIPASSSDL